MAVSKWLSKVFAVFLLFAALHVAAAEIMPFTFEHSKLFQGRGEVTANAEVIDQLDFPATLVVTETAREVVALMESGVSIIFSKNSTTSQWQVRTGFSLPENHRQYLTMCKHPTLDVLYIAAERDRMLYTARKHLGTWSLDKSVRSEPQVLSGLKDMAISRDGLYLATVSSESSNLSIRLLNQETGNIERINSYWAFQENGELHGLKGAWGVDFHPGSTELAVTGNHADSILFFRRNEDNWFYDSAISRGRNNVNTFVRGPAGVTYSDTGDLLFVAMMQAHSVASISADHRQLNQLVISEKGLQPLKSMTVQGMLAPNKVWFVQNRLYIESMDGLTVLDELDSQRRFNHSYFLAGSYSSEVSKVKAIGSVNQPDTESSLVIASNNRHRISFLQISVEREISNITPLPTTTDSSGNRLQLSLGTLMSLLVLGICIWCP